MQPLLIGVPLRLLWPTLQKDNLILYLTEEAIAHPQPHPILEFRDGIGLMQVSSHGRLTAVHCSSSNPEQVSISSNFKVMSRHVYCRKFDEQLFKDIQQAKFKFVMVYSCNMDISQIQKK